MKFISNKLKIENVVVQNISKKFTKHDTQIISDTKQNTLKENQNLLTELKKRIDTQNRLNQKFPSGVGLTEQYYQKLYPNFLILKEQEKNNILLSIQQDLTLKYLNKIHQSSELAPKDVEIMENTTKTQPFDLKLVCTCLNYFDMNIKIAIECSEYAKSIDPLILGHFNWDRIGSFDRKTLIKSDKIEKYTSQQSHIEYDTLFAKYCQEFFYKHDLRFSTEEQTQIQNQFQNSKLQDKNAILNFLQIKHKQPIKLQLKDKKLQPKFLKTLIQREMLQADFQKLKTNNQKLYQTKFLKQEFAKKCELITKIQKAELKQSQEIQAFAKNNQDVFKNRYLDKILKQLNTNNIEQYLAPLQKHERNLEAIKATIKECMQNQHLSKSQKQIFQKEIQK